MKKPSGKKVCSVLRWSRWRCGDNAVEQALLIGSLLLVMMVELLNSAIEAAIDRIGPERHELSGRAKDLGSAAVFIALLNVAVLWLLMLLS